jgi:hypothetical protein
VCFADLLACLQSNDSQPEEGLVWFPQFKVDSGYLLNTELIKYMSNQPDSLAKTVSRG